MTKSSSTILREYLDILNEAPPAAPATPAPTAAPTNTPAPTAAAKPAAQSKFKLVLPTAAQLKAEYKDVGQVSNDITSQGSTPEELQQQQKNYDTRIAKLKAEIANLTQQGKAGAAKIKQLTLARVENEAKEIAAGNPLLTGGQYDPDSIGTLNTQRPFAKLVSDVRGQVGAAYKGDGVPKDDTPMSGWESIAQAIALPQGQALWLDGQVAFKLMYKLNPWVLKAGPNTPEMAALMQYRKQLPDPETGGPSKWNDNTAQAPTVNETQLSNIKVPPVPKLPQEDGELPGGEKVSTNPDGTRSYMGAFGKFTYDKSGKAIKYDSPSIGGLGQSVDLATGRTTTSSQVGDLGVTQSSGGGTPTVSSANMDAGTIGATVHKGVGFGGAGKDVQGPYQGTITNKMTGKTSNVVGRMPTAADMNDPAESVTIKSLKEHIEDIENEGPLSSGDFFHIELAEDEGIETYVIAEWSESVLIEADATVLKLLEQHGATFHDELTEAEYQGRSVPLGKPMAGDVKKSKVYVKKPNGKVVKVNFGDKKMTIKKSNPKRRKSFRARHNCQNPGPRWKARYWSCRAW